MKVKGVNQSVTLMNVDNGDQPHVYNLRSRIVHIDQTPSGLRIQQIPESRFLELTEGHPHLLLQNFPASDDEIEQTHKELKLKPGHLNPQSTLSHPIEIKFKETPPRPQLFQSTEE